MLNWKFRAAVLWSRSHVVQIYRGGQAVIVKPVNSKDTFEQLYHVTLNNLGEISRFHKSVVLGLHSDSSSQ